MTIEEKVAQLTDLVVRLTGVVEQQASFIEAIIAILEKKKK